MNTLWALLAPPCSAARPVCLRLDDGCSVHGVLELVRIHRDGSCFARFENGTTVTIPPLKEYLP